MPPHRQAQNQAIWQEFTLVENPGRISQFANCRHCDYRAAANVTRLRQHLQECEGRLRLTFMPRKQSF
ncbi:hypothetical protein NEUTE1DRAFT_150467 [Neurospora tetrasperma FGSC 2508]|uniref:BED-type domain-containing protein n=1 Tax=Neurospora tetrasperma (strain FGSC 2508 / ATCC MYA-4615 / P0657) TaxID=510951 RepID=F8N133_NEUT8|nr:uncharacterized protein NEUTE1DRAFT_150467 [Neurospora tetrasperma FGSC 2508]EGO53066.1 hypothetical protein NEUTE1DRAFT_150467 [Neurospora tetrasperma FGSC 2508]